MALGLAGTRRLSCWTQAAKLVAKKGWVWPAGGEPAPEVVLTQGPGSVYLGNLTGPLHQAVHAPELDDPSDHLQVGGSSRQASGSSAWAVSTM